MAQFDDDATATDPSLELFDRRTFTEVFDGTNAGFMSPRGEADAVRAAFLFMQTGVLLLLLPSP